MVLKGEAKTLYQREYMRWRRKVMVPGKCEACNRGDYIQAHHEDYNKPTEVLWLCASCHKKAHMIKAGSQRQGSNPYKNPLDKIQQPNGVEYVVIGGVRYKKAVQPKGG
uniref:HNH endonuclease n=1 Tax=viral metagenome TaxID=1070528 RepID=A0A6M3LQA7_9ZZZZ